MIWFGFIVDLVWFDSPSSGSHAPSASPSTSKSWFWFVLIWFDLRMYDMKYDLIWVLVYLVWFDSPYSLGVRMCLHRRLLQVKADFDLILLWFMIWCMIWKYDLIWVLVQVIVWFDSPSSLVSVVPPQSPSTWGRADFDLIWFDLWLIYEIYTVWHETWFDLGVSWFSLVWFAVKWNQIKPRETTFDSIIGLIWSDLIWLSSLQPESLKIMLKATKYPEVYYWHEYVIADLQFNIHTNHSIKY